MLSLLLHAIITWLYIDPYGTNLYAIGGTWEQKNDKFYTHEMYVRYRSDKGTKVGSGARYWDGPGFADKKIRSYDHYVATMPGVQRWKSKRKASYGAPSEDIAKDVKKFICSEYCQDRNMHINLVGWSRGGAIALNVSDLLQEEGCSCCDFKCKLKGKYYPSINWIGLFDAVNMTPHLTERKINPSVIGKVLYDVAKRKPVPQIPYLVADNVERVDHIVKTDKQLLFPTMDLRQYKRNKSKQILNTIPLDDMSDPKNPTKSEHSYIGAGDDDYALLRMIKQAEAAGLVFK